jgi:putative sigma-54 modulation protein
VAGYDRWVKVVVHDRTEELPARVREYAEARLVRVSRHFDRVFEAVVEFARESRRVGSPWIVDITLHIGGRRHPLAQTREAGPDPRVTLDRAVDKVDRQVVKLKEKIKIEKKRSAALAAQPDAADDGLERDPGPERIRMKLKPETPADAEAALADSAHPFYVFLDESSGEINICYRRPDGGIAIVEPVVG